MSDIETWLRELSLEKYALAFSEAEIDFETSARAGRRRSQGAWSCPLDLAARCGVRSSGSEPLTLRHLLKLQQERSTARITTGTSRQSRASKSSDAERRHLTVMFIDLVGSTEMASRIDAEDMRNVITNYQNTVAGVVSRYEGFVAKFMGDGVLCYFGWPRANEDDAERAVRAGLSIIDTIKIMTAPDGSSLATRVECH